MDDAEKDDLSSGVNTSEKEVYDLLCNVFLRTIVFANTAKSDGRELCDILVKLADCAFLFSVRDRKFNVLGDKSVEWGRWSKETISDKVKSLTKGARYLRSTPDKIFLDSSRTKTLPSLAALKPDKIHKIIVGFNIPASIFEHKLGDQKTLRLHLMTEHNADTQFTVGVIRSEGEVVHIFDIEGLRLIAQFADTPFEFNDYLLWREHRISLGNTLLVNGEEDFIAEWFLRRLGWKPMIDPEEFRDISGQLPAVSYLGIYKQFAQSAVFRRKMAANAGSGLWGDMAAYLADGAASNFAGSGEMLASFAGFLAIEPKYLRAYAWHELKRKSESDSDVVDVIVISAMSDEYAYYFTTQHPDMSREQRMKNLSYMADAVAGQLGRRCLSFGLLPSDPLSDPVIGCGEPEGAPVIARDMKASVVTLADALHWLAETYPEHAEG